MTTPLDIVKARWAGMPVPFIDTVNEQVDLVDAPEKWGSAIVQVETRRDVTMGSNPYVDENGNVLIGLFAKAGSGADALDAAVASLRLLFQGYVLDEVGGTFQVLAVEGPLEVDPEADGEWWRIAMMLPYTYQSRRVEPPV